MRADRRSPLAPLAGLGVLAAGLVRALLGDARARGQASRPRRAHEPTDASPPAVIATAAGLVLALGVTVVLVSWLYAALTGQGVRLRPPEAGLQDPVTARETAAPALEQALRALRRAEDQRLHTYGWVDREAGVVRIPIERAMGLIAERGLPARPEPEGTDRRVAADSASGRFVEPAP